MHLLGFFFTKLNKLNTVGCVYMRVCIDLYCLTGCHTVLQMYTHTVFTVHPNHNEDDIYKICVMF